MAYRYVWHVDSWDIQVICERSEFFVTGNKLFPKLSVKIDKYSEMCWCCIRDSAEREWISNVTDGSLVLCFTETAENF